MPRTNTTRAKAANGRRRRIKAIRGTLCVQSIKPTYEQVQVALDVLRLQPSSDSLRAAAEKNLLGYLD